MPAKVITAPRNVLPTPGRAPEVLDDGSGWGVPTLSPSHRLAARWEEARAMGDECLFFKVGPKYNNPGVVTALRAMGYTVQHYRARGCWAVSGQRTALTVQLTLRDMVRQESLRSFPNADPDFS